MSISTQTAPDAIDAIDAPETSDAIDAPSAVETDGADETANAPETENADTPNAESTIPSDAPETSKYVYDVKTVVNAYQSTAIRLDAAKKFANAAMADCVTDAMAAMGRGDIDAQNAAMMAANEHRAVIDALDAVAKTATSKTREITASDYVAATVKRIGAFRRAANMLASGDIVGIDVPAKLRSAVVDGIRAYVADDGHASECNGALDSDAYGDDASDSVSFATRRLIGNASVTRHYAAIAAGRAYDKHGAVFAPVDGALYTFAVIASLRSDAYPNAELSHGAAAAPFVKNGAPRADGPTIPNWTYAPMPSDSRATHGVRFTAPSAPVADDGAVADATAPDAPETDTAPDGAESDETATHSA